MDFEELLKVIGRERAGSRDEGEEMEGRGREGSEEDEGERERGGRESEYTPVYPHRPSYTQYTLIYIQIPSYTSKSPISNIKKPKNDHISGYRAFPKVRI